MVEAGGRSHGHAMLRDPLNTDYYGINSSLSDPLEIYGWRWLEISENQWRWVEKLETAGWVTCIEMFINEV